MPHKKHLQRLGGDVDKNSACHDQAATGDLPDDMELEFYIQFPTAKGNNLNSQNDPKGAKEEERIWPVLTSSSNDKPETNLEKDVLIVLLGWAGAQHKYLSKYSDYYLSRGCIVLRYITPLRYHFVETRKLPHLAQKIVRLLKDLQLDSHPTFFHVFSNGGSFTYSYILRELARVQNTFQMDVKGTILDSAPSPRSMQTCFKALVNIFSNLKIFCMVGDSLDTLEGPGVIEATPLTNWLGRIAKLRNHNFLFLYSDGDELIPCDKIERFAAIAASRGNKVDKVKFAGSEHVLHYRKYPKEYGNAVTQFIRSTMKEHRGKTIWEDE